MQINDNFAKLSEALYISEQKAREAVEMRSKIQREIMAKEKAKKEEELRELAQRARMERAGGVAPAAAGGVAARVDAGVPVTQEGCAPTPYKCPPTAVSLRACHARLSTRTLRSVDDAQKRQ